MTGGVIVVGSVNVDVLARVGHLPVPGETVLGADLVEGLGGKGANQAVALARLGNGPRLVGCVGDDGAAVRATLADEGVDVTSLRSVEGPTGRALVMVDGDGENSIVVAPGANAFVTVEQVEEALADASSEDVLLVQAEIPPAAVHAAIGTHPGTVVYNPAPAHGPLDDETARAVDVLVPNRGELAVLVGEPVAHDLSEVAAQARRLPVGRVVVTLGSAGCLVVDGTHEYTIDAVPVRAIDTTGAGDAFCAGLCDGLARGWPLSASVEQAAWCGALSTTRSGAQGSPTTVQLAEARRGRS